MVGCKLLNKTLVLGLGNPILTDDGIAFYLIDLLEKENKNENFEFQKSSLSGMHNLELMFDFEKVVIIDAIMLGNEIGKVYKLGLDDIERTLHTSSHDLGFRTVIDIGYKYYKERMPKKFVIFGIEVKEVKTFSEKLTPSLENLLDDICLTIKKELITMNSTVK
jgi:hydrogenase maturation protease